MTQIIFLTLGNLKLTDTAVLVTLSKFQLEFSTTMGKSCISCKSKENKFYFFIHYVSFEFEIHWVMSSLKAVTARKFVQLIYYGKKLKNCPKPPF